MARRPPILPGLPLLGSMLDVRRDWLATLTRAAQLGDAVRLRLPMLDAVLLKHPDYIRHVLIEHPRRYTKDTRGYRILSQGLGNGLVTSDGSFWRRQRRIAQPAFHRRRIAAFADTMVRAAVDLSERYRRLGPGTTRDVFDDMSELTLRIVGECLLSTDLSDSSDRVAQAVTTLMRAVVGGTTRLLVLPLNIPTPHNRRLRDALATLDQVIGKTIADRRRQLGQHQDLLEMLMTSEDEQSGATMSDQQLRDEVITIVVAGHETVASALAWTFYLLSRFPAVAEQLRAELRAVLPDQRLPGIDDLPALRYTGAVFQEAMRLYPPGWLLGRRAARDDVIGGYRIEAGQIVYVSPWVTHRDARFWDNPEGFRPERFLDDNAMQARPKCSYLPFLAGPRQCIGNSFAMMEAQLVLATLLSRHHLELVPGHPVVPEPTLTLRPRHGMKMVARPA